MVGSTLAQAGAWLPVCGVGGGMLAEMGVACHVRL